MEHVIVNTTANGARKAEEIITARSRRTHAKKPLQVPTPIKVEGTALGNVCKIEIEIEIKSIPKIRNNVLLREIKTRMSSGMLRILMLTSTAIFNVQNVFQEKVFAKKMA